MKKHFGYGAMPMSSSETDSSPRLDDDFEPPPMTEEEVPGAKRIPRIKSLRRALKLTQEAFAARYGIPLGTLRDWEQGVKEPDTAAKSYIRCIMGDPEGVAKAFVRVPPVPVANPALAKALLSRLGTPGGPRDDDRLDAVDEAG